MQQECAKAVHGAEVQARFEAESATAEGSMAK